MQAEASCSLEHQEIHEAPNLPGVSQEVYYDKQNVKNHTIKLAADIISYASFSAVW